MTKRRRKFARRFALRAPKRAAVLAVERRSRHARWDGIGGQRDRGATVDRRDQRSARSLVAFVSRCQRLAMRQTLSGRTTLAAEQLRPHRQRSPSPSVTAGAAEVKTRRPPRRTRSGRRGIVEERPSRRQANLDAAPAAPHDSSALRKRMLLNRDHLPTCVSACVAW